MLGPCPPELLAEKELLNVNTSTDWRGSGFCRMSEIWKELMLKAVELNAYAAES